MRPSLSLLLLTLLAAPLAAQVAPSPAPSGSDPTVKMDQVDVSATAQTQLNTIDRKIYTVSHDVQAAAGSAADVLQNIPSVEVDIDGNVSLRGDASVQILIDGQSSTLLAGASRADVLAQLPADSIERIEVITSPSAAYKADGTGGIINIVLKKKHALGYSGTARVSAGNNRRYGASVSGNFNPGRYNVFGSYAIRQDDRPRSTTDQRRYLDPVTHLPASTQSETSEESRPFFQLGQAGIDYHASPEDQFGETLDFSYRTFDRHSVERDTVSDPLGNPTSDYFRLRYDPENEGDVQSRTHYEHDFRAEEETLALDFRAEHHAETERNHYTNIYNVPLSAPSAEYIRVSADEPSTEATAVFTDALTADSRLEGGLDRSEDQSAQDHLDLIQDPVSGALVSNPEVTNRFFLDQTVTALYLTYRRRWGDWGVLAGARGEAADVKTDQITSGVAADQTYHRLYPSLNLSYDLTPTQQLQFNYSHRVQRPDGDDLNPYPRYQDPYNLTAGNPALKPEEVHGLEAGYQYKNGDTTYLGTLYYRSTYNSFTQVSQYISSTTLLTTEDNLGSSESGGVELAATATPMAKLTVNASADVFRNQIDASNLGYATKQATNAWSGKLGLEYAPSKQSEFQCNAIYGAKRLTPQGYQEPTFVTNLGYKYDFPHSKLSFVATISDLFNSLRAETKLDTPGLVDDSTRRRSSRIISAGVVYAFGTAKAKTKDDNLKFEN